MMNEHDQIGSDPQAGDDYRTVMQHVADGTCVEPELARRVHEGAERITDEIRREHGDLDVVKLLRDAREDV